MAQSTIASHIRVRPTTIGARVWYAFCGGEFWQSEICCNYTHLTGALGMARSEKRDLSRCMRRRVCIREERSMVAELWDVTWLFKAYSKHLVTCLKGSSLSKFILHTIEETGHYRHLDPSRCPSLYNSLHTSWEFRMHYQQVPSSAYRQYVDWFPRSSLVWHWMLHKFLRVSDTSVLFSLANIRSIWGIP